MELLRFSLLFSSVELKSLNSSDVCLRTNAHSIFCVCVCLHIKYSFFFYRFEHINYINCAIKLCRSLNTAEHSSLRNSILITLQHCVFIVFVRRRRLPNS